MKLSEICLYVSFEITFLPTLFLFLHQYMNFLVSGGKLMLWDATNVDHNVFKVDNNQKMLSTTDLLKECVLAQSWEVDEI